MFDYICDYCDKEFPRAYTNKGGNGKIQVVYWGNRGRYNFRGAKANFLKHRKSCKAKLDKRKLKGGGQ
jgi:hypothetical protein